MKARDFILAALHNRWVSIALLAGLIVLSAIVTADLKPDVPRAAAGGPTGPSRVSAIDTNIFAPITTRVSLAAGEHPFFTKFFEPPPPPPVKPTPPPEPQKPPPPPPPKKVGLVYRGMLESSSGEQQAFVLVETNLLVLTPGAPAVADWAVAGMSLRTLTLTNRAGQTNILPFNSRKDVEVPAR